MSISIPLTEASAHLSDSRLSREVNQWRGPVLILDNGPEFARTVLDAWTAQHGMHRHFIQPGKPVQNAFIKSFNGKFRDECLNEHWFLTLQKAQLVIEAW